MVRRNPDAKPAVAKKAGTKKVEEPDLLAGLEDAAPVEDNEEESVDLLDGISEDNGTAWMPWDEDEQPVGIQGVVQYVGEVESDFGDEEVPLIEMLAADGTLWSVRGYATALRSQLKKLDPDVGDTLAIKYLGEKVGRKSNKEYHNFKGAIRRAG